MNYVLIFAGGVGSRMGSKTPKQFLQVDDRPIIIHTIEKFNSHSLIDGIIIVCKKEYINYCKSLINKFKINKVYDVICGGTTGQMSIYNGIEFLYKSISKNPNTDIVLIHDGVRPIINKYLINKSIECTIKNGNSIAVSKAIETIIKVDSHGNLIETVDRSMCRNAKAPQCFILKDIWEAHQKALSDNKRDMTDSATLMSEYGYKLFTTECNAENIKITTPVDYYMFRGMYEAMKNAEEF
ncbi:MAG: 2-C-methyl-D-erythritol 4-phosphate cytidylyltransferase [Lachnospiraceae bacterium]|jgi:2-C-methyl-D-erythritol 4-phosphate cytidylyltransferase|nr:2-C-methyl-D-erythritol 4-phosphate cytidylyltransferase [Lachnospiraceae bacterium]